MCQKLVFVHRSNSTKLGIFIVWQDKPNFLPDEARWLHPVPRESLSVFLAVMVTHFSLLAVFAGETTTTVAPFIAGGVSDGQWHSVQVQYYNKVRLGVLLLALLFIQLQGQLALT